MKYRLTVGLQSITSSNTLQGAVTPLTSGILSLIDSTVPHLWLPRKACTVFEQAFGLTYDAKTDLYLVNDTTHARLQQLNPTVTFKLGNTVSGGTCINIVLPYLAFDLQASSPFFPTAKNYFPLRRANNDTQYTLGRTFLQEAYIIVDCERSSFLVSQALFKDPNPQQIVTIKPVSFGNHSVSTSPRSSPLALKNSTNIGIIVGAAFALLMICIAVIVLYRKHNSRKSARRLTNFSTSKGQVAEYQKAELTADAEAAKFELAVDEERGRFELAANGNCGNFELAANEDCGNFELASDNQTEICELDSHRQNRSITSGDTSIQKICTNPPGTRPRKLK